MQTSKQKTIFTTCQKSQPRSNQPPDFIKYNGIGYDSLCDVTGFINNLVVYKNELYAAGLFNSINGVSINNIVRYTDTTGVFINTNNFGDNDFVYPNPCSSDGELNIKIPTYFIESHGSLEVSDISGKLVYILENISEGILKVNIPNPGIYYLSLFSNTSFITEKIIITP